MSKWEEWKSSLREGTNVCWGCRKQGRDNSGNNFHFYGEGLGGWCFACSFGLLSDEEKKSRGLEEIEEGEYELVGSEFSEEIHNKLKTITSLDSKGFRSVSKDTTKFFGVRHEYSTETGELTKQYYPNTIDGNLSGYKIRSIPKNFAAIGEVGKDCDPFGWFRFKNTLSKYVLITAGEIDQLSGFQILKEYSDSKGYDPTPVVSSTLGESNVSQFQDKYEWFSKFEKIIICYDNDEAGHKATDKLAKVLPKDKVYVMNLSLKDTNEYLTTGKSREWINLFFKATKHTPAGIVGSDRVMDAIIANSDVSKIGLPSFLQKAEKMLAGGFRLRQIINISASTSIGKTTLINAIIKHILFNSPYLAGVISLEAGISEYSQNLLSEHIGTKLSLIEDGDELKKVLLSDDVQAKSKELFTKPDGSPRFYLLDDQGDTSRLEDLISELIISCGVNIILIDPLSDYFGDKDNEAQESFMKFQKDMIKAYDVTFLNVVHTRKAQGQQKDGGRGSEQDESQMHGSSSISKSAHVNILLSRNKYAEDSIERNTTRVTISKNRTAGTTGFAGEIYYDNLTHRLYDKEEWLEKGIHPEMFERKDNEENN